MKDLLRLFLLLFVLPCLVFAFLLVFLLVVADRVKTAGSERMLSSNNLKQIALAIHTYHDVHKKLPPAVVRDPDGKSLYSWRVLILPFIEQDSLYRAFKLDEAWDTPHNGELLKRMPTTYAAPGLDPRDGLTPYQVFVGPGTVFEKGGLSLERVFKLHET